MQWKKKEHTSGSHHKGKEIGANGCGKKEVRSLPFTPSLPPCTILKNNAVQ